MRKNDEQKVNKLKKEKVKKEKTKKIPKRDNASRQEKKTKIPKIKKVAGEQKREKAETPFYRSIAMRLVAAFLIPVIGVLVLGIPLTITLPMPLWIHTKNLYSRLLIRCSSISIWLSRVRRTNLRPI